MTAAYPWPQVLRAQSRGLPYLTGTTRAGGVNPHGVEQVVLQPYGRLALSLTIPLARKEHQLAYAALMANLRWGPGADVLVPVGACLIQPGRLLLTRYSESPSGETTFDDGTEFIEESVDASLVADAALNATVLSIASSAALQPGQYLGLDERFYQIVSVTTTSPGVYAVTIAPWLRAAAVAGTWVRFRLAVCRMRLKAEHPSVDFALARFGTPTLDFVEAP